MDLKTLQTLLNDFKNERISLEKTVEKLKKLPYEDLGFALVDQHRSLRQGFPEVIYGEGKTAQQLAKIIESLVSAGENVLVTRVNREKAEHVRKRFSELRYFPDARILTFSQAPFQDRGRGVIIVIAAGTADLPVAEEAFRTAEFLGNRVKRLYDVGVAGIHRLLDHMELLNKSSVLVVIAGMEGALPSVVGGLVAKPIIAVPTGVGYGAHFSGIAPLLSMLNSCAPGVAVVNIDNGFGAGFVASLINMRT